ncbi:histidine kinase [Afipia sp. Root123D2]|uniref:sensor histidine kinase n=1 Tax=Afipia sp. Root123D2 TaxID=1736436 RepID=UPI0007013B34|nr:CHASE3 domain-containing protein [Afipia sp. Root123D2]KQW23190.1 histidine kinase [Afipia sp. Root123D2]
MTADAARRRAIWQIALLSASLLVLIVISAASVYMVERTRSDSARALHSAEVENQISLAQLQMRRAESAIRGYALTADESFVADFDEADKQIGPTLGALGKLTIDNPVQQRAFKQMEPLTNQRFAEFRTARDLVRDGKIEDARQYLKSSSGREQMDRIRNVASKMRKEEGRLFRLRTEAADDSQSLAAIVTTTGAGLVIALAGVSIFLVRRSSQARDDAEQLLRDINVNLETAVDERTADLREANEEIQRFAYIVSHDLRSPLVNIMGFTSELEELRSDIFGRIARYSRAASGAPMPPPPVSDQATPSDSVELAEEDKKLSEEFSEALDFIKSSIGKMDRLISAILNLTREGRREFNPVRIDTRELVEGIISTVAHQASEADAQIRVEPLPEIVSDRLSMEQIFSNLIENALKYLKPGVPGDIAISGRNKLGFVIFDITDNGRGIDEKDHQRIFDLFRRAGTQDKPGQGIGLAHVRALVRRMGGTITVSSELGKGSTFTIALPARWTMSRQGKQQNG